MKKGDKYAFDEQLHQRMALGQSGSGLALTRRSINLFRAIPS